MENGEEVGTRVELLWVGANIEILNVLVLGFSLHCCVRFLIPSTLRPHPPQYSPYYLRRTGRFVTKKIVER